MEDIETILNTLIYDGKVEMTIIAAKEGTVGCVDGQMKLYRGVNSIIQPTGLVKTPCGLCPVNTALNITNTTNKYNRFTPARGANIYGSAVEFISYGLFSAGYADY